MKIAVYTITKNEEAFIARWAASAAEADVRLVVDTGSTDGTIAAAKAAGCSVESVAIDTWRFDHARNQALAMLPDDIDLCIALDADEVLQPGWRQALESLPPGVTRPRYRYTWSWNADGSPGLVYGGDKIHARHGYRWKHPVHETLVTDGEEIQQWVEGLEIHHHPDQTKSRGQYLPLLELAAKETPEDDRIAHYLGREYVYAGRYAEATVELQRHLALPSAAWSPERAQSWRLLATCEPDQAERHLLAATTEAPSRREAWVDLAQYYHDRNMWAECLHAAEQALAVRQRPLDYICEPIAWGARPWDLAAVASYWLRRYAQAEAYGLVAVAMDGDERLQQNLAIYTGARSHGSTPPAVKTHA